MEQNEALVSQLQAKIVTLMASLQESLKHREVLAATVESLSKKQAAAQKEVRNFRIPVIRVVC